MKTKINLIIVAVVLFITATIYTAVEAYNWNLYKVPHVEQHVVLGYTKAEDLPVEGNKSFYYKVVADVTISQDRWPSIKTELTKCDTLLVQHECYDQ